MTPADNPLIEQLAELEHQQWQSWARVVYSEVSEERQERWKKLIQLEYSHLTEIEKDVDRIWARKVNRVVLAAVWEKKRIKRKKKD